MGRIQRLFKALLWLALGAAQPALAAEPPELLHYIGRYDFDFSGVYLGYLVISIDETPNTYNMRLLVNSGGIVNLFTRHTSDTVANGGRAGSFYIPQHFESHYKTKEKPRHVRLGYDNKGVVTDEFNEPPEDRNDRPEVPHNLKDGSYDPMTALLAIRAGLDKLRIFDAKRLYEVKTTPSGKRLLALPVGKREGLSYVFTRTPLGGMTGKETKEYNKGEPPLTFYFSNDAHHIPLAVFMPIYFGRLEGILTKECTKWEECLK